MQYNHGALLDGCTSARSANPAFPLSWQMDFVYRRRRRVTRGSRLVKGVSNLFGAGREWRLEERFVKAPYLLRPHHQHGAEPEMSIPSSASRRLAFRDSAAFWSMANDGRTTAVARVCYDPALVNHLRRVQRGVCLPDMMSCLPPAKGLPFCVGP
jgi:hypothetical protein